MKTGYVGNGLNTEWREKIQVSIWQMTLTLELLAKML